MLDNANLLTLMKTVANASPSGTYSYNGEQFSYNALNDTLRNELNDLVGTYDLYEENKRTVFRLMEQTMDDIVPQRLMNAYGSFAEIQTFGQGDRPVFKRRTGLTRAKQFITRVGLAGVYEVFKLGSESFEVGTSAIGGAAQVGFEEFLDGRVNFAELTQVIMDGMDELIYREIAAALMGAINQLPEANRVTVKGFDEAALDYLINTASAYGTPTIYCTREFAVKIIPQDGWVSDAMKDMRWNTGYLANYKGTRVVILPQGLEDETNTRKVVDPGYCWVIPAGANNRPVKVAFEGTTHVRERDNKDDWSRDIQVYRKVGVGVMMTNNIFSYVDTELKGQLDNVPPAIPAPVAAEAMAPLSKNTDMGLGGKVAGDFIDTDVAVNFDGTTGKVTGTLKKVTGFKEFSSVVSEQEGNYFPVKLDSYYKGMKITMTGKKATTAVDTDWIIRVEKGQTYKFESEEGLIFTLDFSEATLTGAAG